MAVLKSELTWSFSRNRLFGDCRRAYFYHYYASWGGWDKFAPELARKAYMLRSIQSIDAWIGDIVHEIIKWVLESRARAELITYEQATLKAKGLLLKTWEQSRAKLWQDNPKHNLNLFEHYYNRDSSREVLGAKLEKVLTSLKNFYSCGLLESLQSLSKEDFLSVDELDTFDFQGVKVFAVPDFALRSNGYSLYDWKTGKPGENDLMQLSCYVLYAMAKWNASADAIKIIPVYLADTSVSLVPKAPKPLDEVRNYIQKGIEDMRACLSNEAENKADIVNFPRTEEAWRCRNCKFQEICV